MVNFIKSDLDFLLEQIKIAELNAAGANLRDLLPNAQVPFGLRTVDGSYNNLVPGQQGFGAADTVFPRVVDPAFRQGDIQPANFFFPGSPPGTTPTTYAQVSGNVFDSQPRTISNLIVDQTDSNPAAAAAAAQNPGSSTVVSPGRDGLFTTSADNVQVNFIPNVTPDAGLSAPFNAWMTFFGQFFDHGLDLVTKGGSGTVFIPLHDDDPLVLGADGVLGTADDLPAQSRFMVLTRATNQPGPDGILGTADDVHEQQNTTTPFVDQNQTYSSHPSHQVFLRAYEMVGGHPVATGKLITNRDLGADGRYGTADDTEIGGMATWKVVKAQAHDILGINLTDKDVFDVPLLATDAYGNFIKGAHGFPQVVMTGNVLVEGDPTANGGLGIDLTNALRTGHQFLIDVAHSADPSPDPVTHALPTADTNGVIGGAQPAGTYDDELLDAHYIAGDGRVNENIGLTAVHSIFHSEHNRLVDQTKAVVLQSNDVTFINQWLLTPVLTLPTTPAQIAALQWNGERLFQAARFGTEMQYQHLVFEEFARTIQPQVDEFLAPSGYDTQIDPAILAEFAHTVYRFGHSMLTETVDRYDPNFNVVGNPADANHQMGLIAAFLNPLAFAASGPTPTQAVGAIVRGVTRTVGNEIDEFVTEALRNNLVGLPLDLPALNIARGRDTGIPTLNAARREFHQMTGDSQLKPYTSWIDLLQHLKHPESLINFIAAYGMHPLITAATTMADMRAAATLIVLGGPGEPADRLDFLNATGDWADGNLAHPLDLDGVSRTGLGNIDFWIGGLAEEKMPFGGMLGSTFNFVFETQLENLQNGDRFYYLSRTAGLHFGAELENNSFAKLVMANSDATHLPNAIFSTPTWTLEVDPTKQFTGLGGGAGRADPTGGIMIDGVEVTPLVIRNNPATSGTDTNYLQYTGEDHVVLGGTAGNDIIISGDGDDTLYGDGGNDRIEGGYGNDAVLGGAGDDILTDAGGDNRVEGGAGNDVISVGKMSVAGNLILGGDGQDFIITTEDITTTFGGTGNDFILGAKTNLPPTGNEGDDWIEKGTQDGAPGDGFSPTLADDIIGNDIFVGGGGFDEMIGEGGDDIFVGSDAQDKMDGMSGFDWVTYKNDRFGVTVDLTLAAIAQPHGNTPNANTGVFNPVGASPASILDRFAEVEGLSGTKYGDVLRGDGVDAATIINHGGTTGSALTNVALIDNLQALLGAGASGFATGNIILGGDGSDIIEGRGGDDLIDGDKWLNVRISVRTNADGTGPQIATFNSMSDMIPYMLNGTYNPGQLVAVREIVNGTPNAPGRADNFDTAVFSGVRADYTVTINNNGTAGDFSDDTVTVIDIDPARDGTDRLTHIERLQFADDTMVLVEGLNGEPVGEPAILDALSGNPIGSVTEGQLLRVSSAGISDPDGIDPNTISYYWQFEPNVGTGVFEDIILLPAGDLAFQSADGATFRVTPDLAGLALRVKAIYKDGHGVTETVFSERTAPVVALPPTPPAIQTPVDDGTVGGAGIHLARSDLNFLLTQMKIAEAHAAGASILSLLPSVRSPFGLRTVDGSYNNLVQLNGVDQSEFGAADNTFPRLSDPVFRPAENVPAGFGPPGSTSYAQTSGNVFDSSLRTISNLIVDQTDANPAAMAAAAQNPGSSTVVSPGLDGMFGTADDTSVNFIPNVTPDAGLSAPFNAWMTFFGQFFDHGLDLVTKGGSGTVFIPLHDDDPLVLGADGVLGTADDLPAQSRFMVLTRATNQPGPDGILGTADDVHEQQNTTTPFVDQNQTYSSHPSHQVFLRAYEMVGGHPVATGKLITNRDLGADGKFGTADDHEIGGMATWKVVKAQAHDILGINLTDKDVFDVPLLATDAYGNFIKGAHGFPQVVMTGNVLVEGDPTANGGLGIDLTNALRTGHQFLIDVAHSADPSPDPVTHALPTADTNSVIGGAQPAGTYDDELLDAHYIAGDGRVNENIGLTTVHSIFHHEHNRLVDQTMATVLASNDVDFLNEWLLVPVTSFPTPAQIDVLQWNGERLFQAAKFGTEMQYQHLVFEEFARTIQPNVDLFFAPTQVYDADLDPSIVAEFAHTVYRFGHSMLTETVDRFDANFNVVGDPNSSDPDQQLGLIAAFLNPLEFAASGLTPEEATGAIVRGVTRTVGNEIDEFVTVALRNNLLGLPLDLPVLNLARGRDVGIPSLNAFRRDVYGQTGDTDMKPYTSWADLVQHLKHPESLINFIAAYGTHSSITGATTLAGKRAAATSIVLGGPGAPGDRIAFLNSTGAYASLPNGVTTTGLDDIDFWIGGLAEEKMPFGGMLGSSFNFVFENQLEKLQDADRFYYLERTAGLAFNAELEGNSFAKLIMANTDVTHLSALVFSTPTYTLEVDQSKQYTGLGPDGRADPTSGEPLLPMVIRNNPETAGPDTNFLHYTGEDHVVLGGTAGDDIILSGDGDDTVYGDAGDDRIDGGYGNDQLRGGDGDDIITDLGGDDNIQGGDGNDVIQGGNGINLIIGGYGSDFIITGEDASEAIGGQGNDFILGGKANEQDMGNEGDDWIEHGTSDGAPGDNFDPLGNDTVIGNDVFVGSGENDKFNAEGGDDIMVGSVGNGDRYIGGSGFDWATFKDDQFGVTIDFIDRFFDQPPVPGSGASVLARFDIVEGLSGSAFADVLNGDDEDATSLPTAGATGSVLTNIGLIDGLQDLLGTGVTFFDRGNIILGGDGSDRIMGRGGDDLIDGDAWLNVRIWVDANNNGIEGTGDQSFDSLIPLAPFMLDGTFNPGQLHIVREVKYASGPDYDTAVFTGNQADYDFAFTFDNDGDTVDETVVVTDSVAARDGTDTLRHIERLQFADGAVDLHALIPFASTNNAPAGTLGVIGVAAEGQSLTVSIAGVTDADNPGDHHIHSPVAYFWQAETVPGTGIFDDITVLSAGESARVGGTTYTPTTADTGLVLRVRAIYKDANGVLEEVYSVPTGPVAAVNDGAAPLTLTGALAVGQTLTAFLGTDPDGAGTTPAFQWFRDGVAVAGATGTTLTLATADLGHHLSVRASYTDGQGFAELVTSASTGAVGTVRILPTNLATLTTVSVSNTLVDLFGAPIVGGVTYGWETSPNGTTWASGPGALTFGPTVTNGAGIFLRSTATYTDGAVVVEHATSAPVHYILDGTAGGVPGHTLTGVAGIDILFADTGDDVITAGAGDDYVAGGAGDDRLAATVGDGNDSYNGGAGIDTYDLSATTAAATVNFAAGISTSAQTGTDTLTSIETVIGGSGNDTYVVTAAGQTVMENVNGGTDAVLARVSYTLAAPSQVETLNSNTTAGVTLTGNAFSHNINGGTGNDTLIGGIGDDRLNGGAGADTLDGGGGNDRFIATTGDGNDSYDGGLGIDTYDLSGTPAGTTVNLGLGTSASANTGTDSLINLENVIGGAGNETFVASAGDGNNSYNGGAGIDTYDLSATTAATTVNFAAGISTSAQTGTDTLTAIETVIGGSGNDTYVVTAAGQTVTENVNGGTDAVLARVSYTLAATSQVETLNSNTTAGVTLTGNAFSHNINGGAGNDTLIGGIGDDRLNGGAGADTLDGGGGNDRFIATTGDGNDSYDGGLGIDTYDLSGTPAGTTVNLGLGTSASANTGTDSLINLENVIGGAGNETFVASAGDGNNSYNGGAGIDTYDLSATTAAATVNFAAGISTSAQTGTDTLTSIETVIGGSGNDTYIVTAAGQTVMEKANGGTDAVLARVSYTLAVTSQVETLSSNTTAGVTLTGNAFSHNINGGAGNDTLIGGSGDDRLNGGAGADTMAGGTGNDTYFVDNAADVVNEAAGAGLDTVFASTDYTLTAGQEIEFLRANAGATGVALTGNALANTIVGGAGGDTLNGGAGTDTMTGGAGNDFFRFQAGFGNDAIADFDSNPAGGQDLIDLTSFNLTAADFSENGGTSVIVTGGANAVITVLGGGPAGGVITLNGVNGATVDTTDFKLA